MIFETLRQSRPLQVNGGNMRLGLFMMPVHPPARSFTETLAEDAEKSLLADRLGFEELWMGEHFSATSEPIPSPLMFFADLISRTKNLRFGTGVINLPNHEPVIVAAEAAQFDHMSRGRFLLGVGPGGLLSDFELFRHTDVNVRNRKVIEAVRIVRQVCKALAAAHGKNVVHRIVVTQEERRAIGLHSLLCPGHMNAGEHNLMRLLRNFAVVRP